MKKNINRISGITVRGFKSIFNEQHIEIRPLTILAGANSAGKSSFLQPLLLLKQTLEAPSDPGSLLLDGPNVRFTKADQLTSHLLAKKTNTEFAVRIDLVEAASLELIFHLEKVKGIELTTMKYITGQKQTDIMQGMTHEQILKVLPDQLKTLHNGMEKSESGPFKWTVRRERCFFIFELVSTVESKRRVSFGPFGVSPSSDFVPYIQGVIHLPGLRGNPRRTYPKTAGGPDFQGTFEPYVASVIAQWQANGGDKLKELGSALETMGLTWSVKVEPIDDTQVELKVGRLPHCKQGGAYDLVSIADVGFGVSQSLPVVVALLAANPGQLVYLEQPEIHLHPLAIRRLVDVLLKAIKRGVVAVIETHSALLLREVQTLVATGKLSKDEVKLHWLQRGEDGGTVVKAADMDDKGAYGDWPEDFDQTELQVEMAYLDAVEARSGVKQ
jgi:hypothetical protein